METRSIDFNKLRNMPDIAREYGCTVDRLNELMSPQLDRHYEELRLPKRNRARKGEVRVVYDVVSQPLKLLQKNITASIASHVEFPEYVQGFVGGRSISTNAERHLAKTQVLKADIANFFESITTKQVSRALESLGCNDVVAEALSKVCTFNGTLPQGAPSSPILSNLICVEMDEQLYALGEEVGATYSRYADDITFSGDFVPSKESIESIFNGFGFELHPNKFFVATRGKPQFVTGLSVFDDKLPRVPKKMKRRLRQDLYFIGKHGVIGHIKKRYGVSDEVAQRRELKEMSRITGLIDFIASIEPEFGGWAKMAWGKILGGTSHMNFHRPHRHKR